MPDLSDLGRVLIGLGALIAVSGVVLALVGRLPLGRLPGDITFLGEGFSCMIPPVSSLIAGMALTMLANWIMRLLNR